MYSSNIILTILIIIFVSLHAPAIADDHGETWQTATDIGMLISYDVKNHVNFSGEIEVNGDVDWFSFYANVSRTNENYIITLTSWLFSNPIKNVKFTLYSIDGTTQINNDLISDCDPNGSLSINWECTSSGTYYIKVEGYESSCNTGEYLGSINIVRSSNSSDSDDSCFIATASFSNNEKITSIIDKVISLLAALRFL